MLVVDTVLVVGPDAPTFAADLGERLRDLDVTVTTDPGAVTTGPGRVVAVAATADPDTEERVLVAALAAGHHVLVGGAAGVEALREFLDEHGHRGG